MHARGSRMLFVPALICCWRSRFPMSIFGLILLHLWAYNLKQALRKSRPPTRIEPAVFGLPDLLNFTLPLELDRMFPRKLNFGCLNPANCFYYDADNNLIVMF